MAVALRDLPLRTAEKRGHPPTQRPSLSSSHRKGEKNDAGEGGRATSTSSIRTLQQSDGAIWGKGPLAALFLALAVVVGKCGDLQGTRRET